MEEEVFKDVVGFEGYYKISNLGRVLSLERLVISSRSSSGYRKVKSKILSIGTNKYGYNYIILRRSNIDKHFLIHQLVAIHFIENPNNYNCINHIDENKLNNIYLNLEWCSVRYNNLYNQRQDKINEILRNKKYDVPAVIQFDLYNVMIAKFKSIHEMHRKTKLSRDQVSKCCRGLRESYNNCIWKFE